MFRGFRSQVRVYRSSKNNESILGQRPQAHWYMAAGPAPFNGADDVHEFGRLKEVFNKVLNELRNFIHFILQEYRHLKYTSRLLNHLANITWYF